MKRSPIMRRTPLNRRGRVKPKRANPRRREAPRWEWREWQVQSQIIDQRAGYRCERCETDSGPFERHHRKRRRDGGDRIANILLLCRDCHKHVTEHPSEARRQGFIVSVSRNPAEVPVLWRRHVWMLLDDDGGMSDALVFGDDAHKD